MDYYRDSLWQNQYFTRWFQQKNNLLQNILFFLYPVLYSI